MGFLLLSVEALPSMINCRFVMGLSQASQISPSADRKSTRLNSSHDQISYAVSPRFTLFPYTTLFRSLVSNGLSACRYVFGVRLSVPRTPELEAPDVKVNGFLVAERRGAALHDQLSLRDGLVAGVANLAVSRSEEHTSELQSRSDLVCRLPSFYTLSLHDALPIFSV